jgi:tyrosyl-tRNA synthetase
MFGKIMSISDELMWRYYELLTDLPPSEIEAMKVACERGEQNPRDLKAGLGRRIIADFHSEAEAAEASDEFDRMFRERKLPTDIPVVERRAETTRLVKLLAEEGLATTVAEAQRLVSQGSVRVNEDRISDLKFVIGAAAGQEVLIQVGKRRFLKVRFR